MNETDIIIRELTQEELIARKPFSHFGWEGAGAFSFLTISDGYWESAKILLERMEKESNNFAVVDSLVYPLFFRRLFTTIPLTRGSQVCKLCSIPFRGG